MIALDTNVVIRYLTDYDPAQSQRARELVEHDSFYIAKTVLLECEWVLRSRYGFSRDRVLAQLEAFARLANARLEDADAVFEALNWARSGVDLADALHLASKGSADRLASFDERFVKAGQALDLPVYLP